MISACLEAHALTRNEYWHRAARRCFEWFLGRNALNVPLYDFALFACSDSLMRHDVNPNRGAEATVHWLLSLLRVQTALHLGPLQPEGELVQGR